MTEALPQPRSIPTADAYVRRLLRVPPGDPVAGDDEAHRLFSASITLSALRCLVSYIFIPIVAPLLGRGVGASPAIGIPLSIVALVFDVRAVRRFWLANHRWRWAITGVYIVVMAMVASLLGEGIAQLV